LYYDQYQKVVGWGLDTAACVLPTGYTKPGLEKVTQFKSRLINALTPPEHKFLSPLPLGLSELDTIIHYLAYLREAIRKALLKRIGDVFSREERNIRWVFTIPSGWPDICTASYISAIIAAGYVPDRTTGRLELISEGEAIATDCLKSGILSPSIHDIILIVNCGKAFVEVSSYSIQTLHPWSVSAVRPATVLPFGSTILNKNFSIMVRSKIRKTGLLADSKLLGKIYAKAIMDFEKRIKDDFRNTQPKWAIDIGFELEFPEADIEEGYLVFSNAEVYSCFEDFIEGILRTVKHEIQSTYSFGNNKSPKVRILDAREFKEISIDFALLCLETFMLTCLGNMCCRRFWQ
jgi:hypothetical protein